MKVALIGSTGFVGKHLQKELLERGHTVTAFVRSEQPASSEARLSFVTGDAYSWESVAHAVRGHDAVLSAFNPGWNDAHLYDNFVRGSAAILRGVEAGEVRRYVVIGGAASLFVAPGVQLIDTEEFKSHVPANIIPGASGAREALRALTAPGGHSLLEWTFVSPPAFLEEGARTGSYRLGQNDLLMDGDKPAGIAVADLAVAVVDELESPKHVRARFTVARKAS